MRLVNQICQEFCSRLADIIHRRSYDFLLRYDFLFNFTPTYQRQQKLIKSLHDFTDKVIVARREKLLSGDCEVDNNNEEGIGSRRKMALLDLLLQSSVDGHQLTNLDIREEIDTFMFEVIEAAIVAHSLKSHFIFIFIARVTIRRTVHLHLRCTISQSMRKCSRNVLTRFETSSVTTQGDQLT